MVPNWWPSPDSSGPYWPTLSTPTDPITQALESETTDMTIAHTSEQASTALELESAPPGSIAQSIYDEDQLIIKMTSTGTPWMRDPWTKRSEEHTSELQ